MSTKWIPGSEAVARQHRLYGVGGWLIVLAIVLIIRSLWLTVEPMAAAFGNGASLLDMFDLNPALLKYVMVYNWAGATASLVLLVMLLGKAPSFPATAMLIFAITWPLGLLMRANLGLLGSKGEEVQIFVSWFFGAGVWIAYLAFSDRVKVTFKGLVPYEAVSVAPADEPSDVMWAKALEEADGAGRKQGLWAKALAGAQGDEKAARVAYMKVRVQELVLEATAEAHAARQRDEHARREAELEGMAEEERRYALVPKGKCPMCKAVIAVESSTCKHCGAILDSPDGWRVLPLET